MCSPSDTHRLQCSDLRLRSLDVPERIPIAELHACSQRVVVNDSLSATYPTAGDASQGTCVSPLMFLLYICLAAFP